MVNANCYELTIEIKEEDIQGAFRAHAYGCPIAKALRPYFEAGVNEASVLTNRVKIITPAISSFTAYPGKNSVAFMRDFDAEREVKPQQVSFYFSQE